MSVAPPHTAATLSLLHLISGQHGDNRNGTDLVYNISFLDFPPNLVDVLLFDFVYFFQQNLCCRQFLAKLQDPFV